MSLKRISTTSIKRANRPPPDMPWIWLTREMLESPAWCAMKLAARRVVERIMLEHMAHGGTENGNLAVTYTNFRDYGVRHKSIKTAIEIADALGWIDITVRGRASFEDKRYASRYALTWLPQPARGKHATNRWRQITTLAAAKAVLREALARREDERDQRAAEVSRDRGVCASSRPWRRSQGR
jgi:hypothetical protein